MRTRRKLSAKLHRRPRRPLPFAEAADAKKFEADARRLADHLFTLSPFKERAKDFNVWALMAPTAESGISRPSTGTHHYSLLGTRYDIFGSERYALTLDNRALRVHGNFVQ